MTPDASHTTQVRATVAWPFSAAWANVIRQLAGETEGERAKRNVETMSINLIKIPRFRQRFDIAVPT